VILENVNLAKLKLRKIRKEFKLVKHYYKDKGCKKMAYGMMMDGYGSFGMGLWWLVQLGIGAFVFGIIFWWTKKLVPKSK